MVDTKHFIVIGLGSFGTALAERLCRNGCRVTGVDGSRERVEELKDVLLGKKKSAADRMEGITDWSDRFIEKRMRRPGRALPWGMGPTIGR